MGKLSAGGRGAEKPFLDPSGAGSPLFPGGICDILQPHRLFYPKTGGSIRYDQFIPTNGGPGHRQVRNPGGLCLCPGPGPRRWGRSRWMIFPSEIQCARPGYRQGTGSSAHGHGGPGKAPRLHPGPGRGLCPPGPGGRPQPPVRPQATRRTHFYLTAGAAGALCCALSALGCQGISSSPLRPISRSIRSLWRAPGPSWWRCRPGWRTFRLTLPPWRPPSPPR